MADQASYFSAIDLSTLTPPVLIDQLAYTDVFSSVMRDFVRRDPQYTIFLESDPAPKVLEVTSYREHLLRQAFNDRAQQLLLAYAVKSNLDHLGAFYGVYRLEVTPADNSTFPPTPQVMENDTDYRKRIQLAPEAWSCAGPAGSYLFHTYAASAGVQNAVVYNHASGLVRPGTVLVVIKIREGFDRDTVVKAVRARLFRDDVKPLTDTVLVQVATPAAFSIDATLFVNGGPDVAAVRVEARNRLTQYLALRSKVGMLIAYSGIIAALNGTYVERIAMRAPISDFQPGLTDYAHLASLQLEVQRV